jgi:hypothetical protein
MLCSLAVGEVNGANQLLFDQNERAETRPKRERESDFAYLNSSARNIVAAARGVLEQWFESYPEAGKDDLCARLRSPDNAQHASAFGELYLHELFSQIGFRLEVHPDVNGTPNHPDFLVSENGVALFYLEGVVAGLPSTKEAGAEARLANVFDRVNKMQIPGWFLHVEYRGTPETQPPVKELRRNFEQWLASLDAKAIDNALKAEDWDGLPQFEWQSEGLTLCITPSPRTTTPELNSDSRPIGVIMGEPQLLSVDKDIRRAIEVKAKKYGKLALPLVVAVNVLSEHCDEIDINNALFGSESIVVTMSPEGSLSESGRRMPDGVWFGKQGARNKFVSAVLVGSGIYRYTCGKKTPLLVHHPYPMHRLSLSSYPLPEFSSDEETSRMTSKRGKEEGEFLRLPDPWPPEEG